MVPGGPKEKWQPIFEGAEAERVLEVVLEIAESLRTPPCAWIPEGPAEPFRMARGASLSQGSAGLALFFAYLAQLPGTKPHFADEADRFLNHACDALAAVEMPPGLFRGVSGIAWTAEHLRGFLYNSGSPAVDPNEELDHMLARCWPKPDKFDLWDGCVGMGIYALERCPREPAKKRVELLVEHLESLGDQYDKGITWFTVPEMLRPGTRQNFPKGYFDLGLAHGAAGVIAFLAYVHKAGIAQGMSRRLLHSSIPWLMRQRRADSSGSLFPGIVVPPDKPMYSTFSWSRGDPGIAAALLPAIQCIGEPARENPALEIAHASLKRIPHIPFTDPTLCNGTAGLAHLFNRMYQATGNESLKNAARTLFEKTLSLRKPGQGVAGFFREGFNDERDIVELYDPGLIQGAAGIGLALLAAASKLEPAWDRIILLSGPRDRQS